MSHQRGYEPTNYQLEKVIKDAESGLFSPAEKRETAEKARALRIRLEAVYHMEGHIKADKIWELAWEYGYGDGGATAVIRLYDELYSLVRKTNKGAGK